MNCPICANAVDDMAVDCGKCGEAMTPWRTIVTSAGRIHRRGLALAAQHDYLGACLAFFEAALSNPLDADGVVDAARALVHLGRTDDALRLLAHAQRRNPKGNASQIAAAIRELLRETQREATDAAPAAAVPGVDDGAAASATAPDNAGESAGPVPLWEFLGLPALPRKRSFLSRIGGSERGDAWAGVLGAEKNWDGQPLAIAPWLTAVVREGGTCPAWSYMLGLECWQRQDPSAALPWFLKSLKDGAPFLNPAAYVVCSIVARGAPVAAARPLLAEHAVQPGEFAGIIEALRRDLTPARHGAICRRLDEVDMNDEK